MKRIYVNEEWCLGCHLCEYNCAFANTISEGKSKANEMAKALKVRSENFVWQRSPRSARW